MFCTCRGLNCWYCTPVQASLSLVSCGVYYMLSLRYLHLCFFSHTATKCPAHWPAHVCATSPAPPVCLIWKTCTWWHMWRRLFYGACHHLVSHRPSVWSSRAKATLTQTQKVHIHTSYTNTHSQPQIPPHLLSLNMKAISHATLICFFKAWSSASFCGRMVSKLE